VDHDDAVPRTHDLSLLFDLAAKHLPVPPDVAEAAGLTLYAIVARYPADLGEATFEEHAHALGLARSVVAWAVDAVANR